MRRPGDMSKKTGQTELDEYIFTRPEMAKLLNISTNALRMRMRKGKCDLEYRFDGKQFKFKRLVRDRVNTMKQDLPNTTHDNEIHDYNKKIQKKINRGNTHKGRGKYPNDVFKLQNEMKIMNHIQGKFRSESHRKEFEKLNEEGLKIAQENLLKKEAKDMGDFRSKSKYGGMIKGYAGQREEDEHQAKLTRKHFANFDVNKSADSSIHIGGKSYYEMQNKEDDGSVEIDPRDFPADNREPVFSSKVEEAIWRLKNKK